MSNRTLPTESVPHYDPIPPPPPELDESMNSSSVSKYVISKKSTLFPLPQIRNISEHQSHMHKLISPSRKIGNQAFIENFFSEEEIVDAFQFIDLDKNGYIGAAEIQHILVCMGELITDDEVDMMIRLVDLDGDGQVSLKEILTFFSTKDETLGSTSSHSAELDGPNKLQENVKFRDEKRALLKNFVYKLGWEALDLRKILDMHRNINSSDPMNRERLPAEMPVLFDRWVELTGAQNTLQNRKLFELYSVQSNDASNDALDLQSFLIACSLFVKSTRYFKSQFAFDVYDEDRSGFISKGELIKLLMATHSESYSNVAPKASIIMEHANANRKGYLSFEEFETVSRKFPNICFPTF